MKNKITRQKAIAILAIFIIMWAAFAFVALEPNPFLWTQSTRSGYAALSILLSCIAFCLVMINSND